MEFNPNHKVTQGLHDHWHKIAALILHKLGVKQVVIDLDDFQSLEDSYPNGMPCVVAQDKDNKLTIWLVTEQEGRELAKKEGGLLI
jgi:hypothetical protein